MNNNFKNLIKDSYEKATEDKVIGLLYSVISTVNFIDIKDINEFIDKMKPDMLYLKSIVTGEEAEIYDYELEEYSIKSNKIYIKCKSKEYQLNI